MLMKSIIKTLQNPYIKLFVAPFAFILFGSLLGARQINHFNFKSFFLIYFIVAILEVINHFLRLKLDQKRDKESPQIIFLASEFILIVLYIIFALDHHWIINLLILLAIAFTHVLYYPFKFTGSIYHSILNVFFYGFIWQVIAYFSQNGALHSDFLVTIIPITFMLASLETEGFTLRLNQIPGRKIKTSRTQQMIMIALALLAIGLGFYFSLPTKSFYLLQILFVIISILVFLPNIVTSTEQQQIQNKLNYLSSVFLIFNIFYSLSYLF